MATHPPARQQNARTLRRCRQGGGATIEAALTFPLLLTLLFGGVNYGVVLYDKSVLAEASREAARAGVVFKVPLRPSSSDIAAVAQRFQGLLISFDPASASTFSVTVAGSETPTTGNNLSVTVNYRFKGVASNLTPGLGNGLWLSSTTAMTYE